MDGTIYNTHTLKPFDELGLDSQRVKKLASKLHVHSVNFAAKLVHTRRALSSTVINITLLDLASDIAIYMCAGIGCDNKSVPRWFMVLFRLHREMQQTEIIIKETLTTAPRSSQLALKQDKRTIKKQGKSCTKLKSKL